jgi:DNA-binding NtrC family response regulator
MSNEIITMNPTADRILVVEDEAITRENLRHALDREGYVVETAEDGASALLLFAERRYDLVLTDLKMPGADGLTVLTETKRRQPEAEVIVLTGYATVETAIAALQRGAFHYLAKPFKLEEVRAVVRKALETSRLRRENRRLREELERTHRYAGMIGRSAAMQEVFALIERVAETDAPVLLTGETGTGKELAARAIHTRSPRRQGPFVPVNCGALSEELLANELFGHEKEAFTGATSARAGLIEGAQKGTLFLDEIAEMTLSMQVKLLRVLQEREVVRVGGTKAIPVDVRVVAASNRDLPKAVANGLFRADLYYRLNVVHLHLPPLAERREDIPLLAAHFLEKYNTLYHRRLEGIDESAMRVLLEYDYPGNVRELENLIARAVALEKGSLLAVESLPPDLREIPVRAHRRLPREWEPAGTIEEVEKAHIERILEQTGFHRSKAALILGIDRTSLWRKIKRYGITLPEGAPAEEPPAEEESASS